MESCSKVKTWYQMHHLLIVNEETEYSIPWNAVNIRANIIVNIAPYNAPFLFPCIKEWWEYVIVTPDANNITVFK